MISYTTYKTYEIREAINIDIELTTYNDVIAN